MSAVVTGDGSASLAPPVGRRRIVGVMGSGQEEFAELAEAAGRVIARSGYHLLTGGGDGVMRAAARAFTAVGNRSGLSLGIVRADGDAHLREAGPKRRYRPTGPNPYVEIAILTHLPYSGRRGKEELSRNHINVLTAHGVVVLPGGEGTASELELALEYGRPVVLFVGAGTVAGRDAGGLERCYPGRLEAATSEADLASRLRELVGTPVIPGPPDLAAPRQS